jgi:hypothetical protein
VTLGHRMPSGVSGALQKEARQGGVSFVTGRIGSGGIPAPKYVGDEGKGFDRFHGWPPHCGLLSSSESGRDRSGTLEASDALTGKPPG